MSRIQTFKDVTRLFQANLESDARVLDEAGFEYETQLKAYLIESSFADPSDTGSPLGSWRKADIPGWYIAVTDSEPHTFVLDTTSGRVWKLYSLLDATQSDALVAKWIAVRKGLDRCWLTRGQLLHWEGNSNWVRRGLGLKFSDGLTPEEDASNFSLKAWHGSRRRLEGLDELLNKAEHKFATNSVRWQKLSDGHVTLSAEWYSEGKVTVNRAASVDDAMLAVGEMAIRYGDALEEATKLRDRTLGAFEIDFTQVVDLDSFSSVASKGSGDMKLWMVEDESDKDFRRFKGVDLHTWDRLFLDLAPDHGFVTIPGKGCVNAAPRIATLQGEDNAGRTSIFMDGVELFA